jgi:hypothetical protein
MASGATKGAQRIGPVFRYRWIDVLVLFLQANVYLPGPLAGPLWVTCESESCHILHSPTIEKSASGLRAIRLESTNVDAFDGVGIESDSEGSVGVDRDDFVGTLKCPSYYSKWMSMYVE